jgi:apolipoprotein D and lipocalin family protein
MKRALLPVTLSWFLALIGCGDTRPPLTTVASVDMMRMEGTWYVTHHIPYWLEESKVATADVYKMRSDGRIDTSFVFHRERFDAPEEHWDGISWIVDTATNAHWKVRFFWPFSTDYLIIDRDPDYRWIAVGHPSRDYFWILSRTRQLAPATVEGIMSRAAAQGYDRKLIAPVPQPAD